MSLIKTYIEDNLICHGYGTYVKEPSIDDILFLERLCKRAIDKYFEDNDNDS